MPPKDRVSISRVPTKDKILSEGMKEDSEERKRSGDGDKDGRLKLAPFFLKATL